MRRSGVAMLLSVMSGALGAQTRDSVPAERLAARRWFADARFGLFIHWGVYSELGAGECTPI